MGGTHLLLVRLKVFSCNEYNKKPQEDKKEKIKRRITLFYSKRKYLFTSKLVVDFCNL
jgi:hypothetical protein